MKHKTHKTAHTKKLCYKPSEQQESKTETMMQALQQSMMEFISFMRNTMQDIMRNQNLLMQMLVSQQSK